MKYDLWEKEREAAQNYGCLKAYRYDWNGKPALKLFFPKAFKPHKNYLFPTTERREQYIQEQITNAEDHHERVEQYRKDRKGSTEDLAKVKVGDIFSSTWGYDQTNVDFYQVVKVAGRYAWIAPIATQASMDVDGGQTQDAVMPWPNKITGEAKRRLIQFNSYHGERKEPYFHLTSYSNAYPFKGNALLETNPVFGH